MIAKLLKQLEREINRLPATDGRKIARRNGRKRVLAQLRKIRAAVDEHWPAIVERNGRARLDPKVRARRAKLRGLTLVTSDTMVACLAMAGVKIRRINGSLWTPEWARIIYENQPEKLVAAVKDRKLRAAILAEHALLA